MVCSSNCAAGSAAAEAGLPAPGDGPDTSGALLEGASACAESSAAGRSVRGAARLVDGHARRELLADSRAGKLPVGWRNSSSSMVRTDQTRAMPPTTLRKWGSGQLAKSS